MSLIRFYVRHEKLILPNVVQTEAGFYSDDAPVAIFEIRNVDEWRQSLYKSLMSENQVVPTPDGSDEPGSAILEALDITKWSTFETSAVMYTVHLGSRYISIYRTGKGPDGMWRNEDMDHRKFDSKTPIEFIVSALQADIVKQPEANRPKTSLMLAPPSS